MVSQNKIIAIQESNSGLLFCSGPPLPPEPILVTNSSSQLNIQWQIPYSHENFGVQSYNIQIVNMSSGNILDSVLNYSDISYVYTFENDVQYCQILTVSVTAVSVLGPSVPGSVSRGIPIGESRFINYFLALNLSRNSIIIIPLYVIDCSASSIPVRWC